MRGKCKKQICLLSAGLLGGCLWSLQSAVSAAAKADAADVVMLQDTVGTLISSLSSLYRFSLALGVFLTVMTVVLGVALILVYRTLSKEIEELKSGVRPVVVPSEPAVRSVAMPDNPTEVIEPPEPEPEPAPPPPPPEPAPAPLPSPEPEPAPPPPPAEAAPVEEDPMFVAFLEQYMDVAKEPPGEMRERRIAGLLADFGAQTFSVNNKSERKKDPNTKPVFHDVEDGSGDFWAIMIMGTENFNIVPSLNVVYDEEYHLYGGMKETYASNYDKGDPYSRIELNAPAIFSHVGQLWAPVRPGKITLV